MELRRYRTEDVEILAGLFYDTIHTVNLGDYTQAQVDAWACGTVDLERWDRTLTEHLSLVAEEGGQIVGFGDIRADGYLDRLFVHRAFQRRGVATALCDALEAGVSARVLTTHASITARPFFAGRGYRVVRQQQVERRGVLLTNFVMEKTKAP